MKLKKAAAKISTKIMAPSMPTSYALKCFVEGFVEGQQKCVSIGF
jgi:hypothetical protein